jgi:hypothetical protein
MRRLYNISKVQAVATTRAEVSSFGFLLRRAAYIPNLQKRRVVLIDTLVCVLFPMVEMVFGV